MSDQNGDPRRLSAFDEFIGTELLAAEDGLVEARIPLAPQLLQPLGMVHGGVYASIAEGLASLGTNRAVVPEDRIGVGQSNSCTFLRPITSGAINAKASVRRRGRTTWGWDVEIFDDDERLCALGRVAIAVRSRSALQPAT
jgi:uncharacterized protein (TIGR00369 family)